MNSSSFWTLLWSKHQNLNRAIYRTQTLSTHTHTHTHKHTHERHVSVCLSVRPSQAGVLLRRLNLGLRKQRHAIDQRLFLTPIQCVLRDCLTNSTWQFVTVRSEQSGDRNIKIWIVQFYYLSKPAVRRLGIERHPYTKSRIDQIACVCMCVQLLLPNHWTDLHKSYTSKLSILRWLL